MNWRNHPTSPNTTKQTKGKNPQRNGQPTRCNINHWATQCPDRSSDDVTYMVHELVLQNSDNTIECLLSEAWSTAVLDSGATSTVCGQVWFNEFLDSLNEETKSTIRYTESSKPFRFGDGKKILSHQAATIPAMIGSHRLFIKTDIIAAVTTSIKISNETSPDPAKL